MAVREFNGTTDTMFHSSGGLSAMTFGTTACIFKTDTVTGDHWYGAWHNSGGSLLAALVGSGTNCNMYSAGFVGGPAVSIGPWYLAVIRKATGTATPRFSVYNFTADTWAHAAGSASVGDWTAPGASGTIRTEVEAAERVDGRIAVRACWTNEVHWAADSGGDTAIEAAGLETALTNWVNEGPDALWPFNQANTGIACDDIIGGADQSSLTGTTVVEGDDPPGFSFTLVEPPIPDLYVVSSGVTLA